MKWFEEMGLKLVVGTFTYELCQNGSVHDKCSYVINVPACMCLSLTNPVYMYRHLCQLNLCTYMRCSSVL